MLVCNTNNASREQTGTRSDSLVWGSLRLAPITELMHIPVRRKTGSYIMQFYVHIYMQLPTSIDAYLYSFLPSTIQLWNSLPAQLMQSLTLTDFKYNLYVHYTH